MIREITTFDGIETRSRGSSYDSRPTTEVKVRKMYQCTECGIYFTTKPTKHTCQIPESVL